MYVSPVPKAGPPVALAYQLTSSPKAGAPGRTTLKAGVAVPKQMLGLLGVVGASIKGQAQLGAVTIKVS